MRVVQGIKSLFQFVRDADTVCLVRVAVGNFFKHFGDEDPVIFRFKKWVRSGTGSAARMLTRLGF